MLDLVDEVLAYLSDRFSWKMTDLAQSMRKTAASGIQRVLDESDVNWKGMKNLKESLRAPISGFYRGLRQLQGKLSAPDAAKVKAWEALAVAADGIDKLGGSLRAAEMGKERAGVAREAERAAAQEALKPAAEELKDAARDLRDTAAPRRAPGDAGARAPAAAAPPTPPDISAEIARYSELIRKGNTYERSGYYDKAAGVKQRAIEELVRLLGLKETDSGKSQEFYNALTNFVNKQMERLSGEQKYRDEVQAKLRDFDMRLKRLGTARA